MPSTSWSATTPTPPTRTDHARTASRHGAGQRASAGCRRTRAGERDLGHRPADRRLRPPASYRTCSGSRWAGDPCRCRDRASDRLHGPSDGSSRSPCNPCPMGRGWPRQSVLWLRHYLGPLQPGDGNRGLMCSPDRHRSARSGRGTVSLPKHEALRLRHASGGRIPGHPSHPWRVPPGSAYARHA
ncbi:hypothetical protein XP420_15780 [Xanthomonas perforans]|nr:hypothetical protein XP420_15780 [Xanthomonas perforans]